MHHLENALRSLLLTLEPEVLHLEAISGPFEFETMFEVWISLVFLIRKHCFFFVLDDLLFEKFVSQSISLRLQFIAGQLSNVSVLVLFRVQVYEPLLHFGCQLFLPLP